MTLNNNQPLTYCTVPQVGSLCWCELGKLSSLGQLQLVCLELLPTRILILHQAGLGLFTWQHHSKSIKPAGPNASVLSKFLLLLHWQPSRWSKQVTGSVQTKEPEKNFDWGSFKVTMDLGQGKICGHFKNLPQR